MTTHFTQRHGHERRTRDTPARTIATAVSSESTVEVCAPATLIPLVRPPGSHPVNTNRPINRKNDALARTGHPMRCHTDGRPRHSQRLSARYIATTPTTHQRTDDPLRTVSTAASTRTRYSAMAKVVVANWERGDEVSGGSSPPAIVHPPSSLGLSTPG